MGQFKKQKIKNLENESDWYIILLIMLLLSGSFIDKYTKSAIDNPWPAIVGFIAILLLLWRIIKWCRKQYLITYPFKMRFSDKGPYDSGKPNIARKQTIQYIHNLGHDSLKLRIKLKKEMNFEEINIRLVVKKWFGLYWEDTSTKVITIQKITDLLLMKNYQEAGRFFSEQNDFKGGRNAYYKPSYSCPKHGYLWYEIELVMSPEIKEWQGYISFQHRRGGSYKTCVRKKITVVKDILI